jgi:cellulase/cellobiase CelA1
MAERAVTFLGLDSGVVVPPSSTPPTPPPSASTPPPATGGCRVGYTVNSWNSGLTAAITITNSGPALTGWTLGFTLPAGQSITSGWNATWTGSRGAVTARNVSYNGTLATGASTSIGLQATHTGDTGRPAAFTLNGAACTVA